MCIDLWLMVAYPENFGRAVSRAGQMTARFVDGVGAAKLGHALTLGLGTLVGPDDAGTQGRAISANGHAAHHLAAKANGSDIGRGNAGLGQQLPAGHADGPPPVVRILFGPVGLGVTRFVAGKRAADLPSVCVKEGGFVAGRTQIVGENIGLGFS